MKEGPISTLVVDDEPLARRRLLRLCEADPELSVLGECGSVAEALALGPQAAPELLLLDVRMPAQDGFDLLAALRSRGIDPYVIFVTAYSEHAVRAFEVEAVDYVLKPFDDERFRKALARAKAIIASGKDPAESEAGAAHAANGAANGATEAPGFPERLLITEGGKVMFVPTREVEFVQSAGKYVKIYAQGRCHLMRQPLHEIESRLDPNQFVRVHRSSVVNVEHVVEIHPLFHGDCELVLKRGTRLPMSRRFRSRFDRFLIDR